MSSLRYRFVVLAALVLVSGAAVLAQAAPARADSQPGMVQPTISNGDLHTIVLATDGSLWGWGYNLEGAVGTGDYAPHYTPTQIGTDDDWIAVSTGYWFTLAIKSDHSLWAWGYAGWGELGLGETGAVGSPAQVGTDHDWTAVSGGGWHSLALKSDGTLWGWGGNWYQQSVPGVADTSVYYPTQIGTAEDWAAISGGANFSAALKSDGTLWAWGGVYGPTPTEIGTDQDHWTALSTGYDEIAAIKSDGTLWTWNDYLHDSGTQASPDHDWVAVSAGTPYRSRTMALKSDGTLWAYGDNYYGELGLGDKDIRWQLTQIGTDHDWAAAAATGCHGSAFKRDGSVWTWGRGDYGELGLGDLTERLLPTRVPFNMYQPGIDTTPPVVTITSPSADAQYVTGQVVAAAWTVDDTSAVVSSPVPLGAPIDTSLPGSHTFVVSATDAAGNVGSATVSYTVLASSGVAQPINPNGSSVFKARTTIPVKITLTDALGLPVMGLAPKLCYQKSAGGSDWGPVNEAISTCKADTGNTMRETSPGVYVFNLDARTLGAGLWRLTIDLGNGGMIYATFAIEL